MKSGHPALPRFAHRVHMILFAGALLLLGWMVSRWLAAPSLAVPGLPAGTIAIAAGAYLIGHLVRIARLALIIGDERLSLRDLIAVHMFTSAVNLGVPFKLGELYRIGELSTVTNSMFGAVVVAWVERCFDIGLILALLLIAIILSPASAGAFGAVLGFSLFFVVMTLIMVALVPDNLRRLGNHIIRRYDAGWSIGALKAIAQMRGLFRQSSRMLQGRYASLTACTLVIWAFEAIALTVILTSHGDQQATVAMLLSFLSTLIEGQTLLTHLAAMTHGETATIFSAYLLATQVPLLIVGLASGVFLARRRATAIIAAPAKGMQGS